MKLEEFADWLGKNPANTDELIDSYVVYEIDTAHYLDVDLDLKEWLGRINRWAGNEKNNSYE